MTFGDALEAVRMGARVRRRGWNGKGMWVALTPAHAIPVADLAQADASESAVGFLALELEAQGISQLLVGAHLDMKAADGSLVIGWLASQTDMLAKDWEVMDVQTYEMVTPSDEAEAISRLIGPWPDATPPIDLYPQRAICRTFMRVAGALTPCLKDTELSPEVRQRIEHALALVDGIITTAARAELKEAAQP